MKNPAVVENQLTLRLMVWVCLALGRGAPLLVGFSCAILDKDKLMICSMLRFRALYCSNLARRDRGEPISMLTKG